MAPGTSSFITFIVVENTIGCKSEGSHPKKIGKNSERQTNVGIIKEGENTKHEKRHSPPSLKYSGGDLRSRRRVGFDPGGNYRHCRRYSGSLYHHTFRPDCHFSRIPLDGRRNLSFR